MAAEGGNTSRRIQGRLGTRRGVRGREAGQRRRARREGWGRRVRFRAGDSMRDSFQKERPERRPHQDGRRLPPRVESRPLTTEAWQPQ